MALDKDLLEKEILEALDRQAAKQSTSDDPKDSREELAEDLAEAIYDFIAPNLAPAKFRYPDVEGTLVVDTSVGQDVSKLVVLRDGITVDWDSTQNGIDRSGNDLEIWDFHIPLEMETIIIYQYQ